MSEPTPREALRERLIHHLRDDRKVFSAATGLYPEIKPMLDNLEKFICTEVLAVLDRLDKSLRAGGTDILYSFITQERQRYGGKEQE